MERNAEQEQLREQYVIALLQAALPIQERATDREVTMELLMEAADIFKDRIQKEREELRMEQD
jgi:hypothetical protein